MSQGNEVNETDKTVKVIVLLLLPFFLCLIVYYVVGQTSHKPTDTGPSGGLVLLKVIIILVLCSYVLSSCYAFQIEWRFGVLITVGLVFSSAADGLTLFEGWIDDVFSYELLLFGSAHILYTIAFGFTPLKAVMGVLIALPFVGILMVLIPKTSPPTDYYISAYMVVNMLMEWRIVAKVSQHSGPLKPGIVATTIGAVALVVSDAVLTYDKYHSHIRFSNIIIPLTYYTGQLGIASSIFHLPHQLRPPNPHLHISADELCDQICGGCPFP